MKSTETGSTVSNDPKQSALLKYLREKSENKKSSKLQLSGGTKPSKTSSKPSSKSGRDSGNKSKNKSSKYDSDDEKDTKKSHIIRKIKKSSSSTSSGTFSTESVNIQNKNESSGGNPTAVKVLLKVSN